MSSGRHQPIPLEAFSSTSALAAEHHHNQQEEERDGEAPCAHPRLVFGLFLAGNLITFILTVIPVAVSKMPLLSAPFYSVSDLLRFLEPVLSAPFQLWLLLLGIRQQVVDPLSTRRKTNDNDLLQMGILVSLFAVCWSIYQQGAGFHSAANLFKNVVEDAIIVANSTSNGNPALGTPVSYLDVYSYLRNEWEHLIAHYMYAAGAIAMSFIYAFIYRDYNPPSSLFKLPERILFGITVFIYTLIIGSVAIEFPSGSIVSLVLIFVFGFGTCGGYLLIMTTDTNLPSRIINVVTSPTSRPVLKYYLYSYASR